MTLVELSEEINKVEGFTLAFYWCSSHPIGMKQLEELNTLDSVGSAIYELREINLSLQERMSRIKGDTNLYELAEELIKFCDDYDVYRIPIIVDPAGNAAFQHVLAKTIDISRQNKDYLPHVGYSFSERVSKEELLPNGEVKKTSVFSFKHFDFY